MRPAPALLGPGGPGRGASAGLRRAWLALLLLVGGCGGGSGSPAGVIHLYTSVTQETVSAVVAAYRSTHPRVAVDVFRAPTGVLSARIAAEERSGGVRADVIWATDPLSMGGWEAQGLLLRGWAPADASAIPSRFRTASFWGTRVLRMVVVYRKGLRPVPAAWHDLADHAYRGLVEIPDPSFAGSALAVLGYLAEASGYGMAFYRELKANGARQVASPDTVVADVAEGRAELGITLESSATAAVKAGSPVVVTWPSPGAIGLYSPIAVSRSSKSPAARSFVEFVLSTAGQRTIAASGWQPVLPGIPGPPTPAGKATVFPSWTSVFARQRELLLEYRSIFGG